MQIPFSYQFILVPNPLSPRTLDTASGKFRRVSLSSSPAWLYRKCTTVILAVSVKIEPKSPLIQLSSPLQLKWALQELPPQGLYQMQPSLIASDANSQHVSEFTAGFGMSEKTWD